MEELTFEVFEPEIKYESEKYPLQEETGVILGVCFEVSKHLRGGLSEAVYQEALEYEFSKRKIPFERQKKYLVHYKDVVLKKSFVADFLVYDKIILEIKAQNGIPEECYQQVINYLAISKNKVGLIVNFYSSALKYKRVIL
ncbi:MAG TPA: GxxExxY protein [Flavobacteriales bacterium]|nr:GxxExxY protein [Flavobacteriales bacterium]